MFERVLYKRLKPNVPQKEKHTRKEKDLMQKSNWIKN